MIEGAADEPLLARKVAAITGGSRGLGRALVDEFARHGADVATIGRSLPDDLPGDVLAVSGDLASAADADRFCDAVLERFGRVDILVNNAALLTGLQPVHDTEDDEWRAVFEVNLFAPFRLVRRLVPGMIARRSGVVLNVSSSVGRKATSGWSAYGASKAGLDHLTELLALELAEHGIRVLTMVPRRLRTEMRALAHPHEDPADQIDPRSVAPLFAFAASDRCELSGDYLDLSVWRPPD